MANKDMNAGDGIVGSSKIDQAPARSSYRSLGVDERIEKGTQGARNTIADAKYAGDRKEGQLHNVSSAVAGGKESNAGSKAAPAATRGTNQYEKDGKFKIGGFGARETVADGKYGSERIKGQLVGRDAGKEKATDAANQYIGGPVADKDNTIRGTHRERTKLARAASGISQKHGKQNQTQ